MEKVESWDKEAVISVLAQGKELAKELKKLLNPTITSTEACAFLLEKILCSYDNAMALLDCMALLENLEPSKISIMGSPLISDGSNQDPKDQANKKVSKKRKASPKCSEQVHVFAGAGPEGQLDDGYNWRKYGQKDILGTNHPRAYYRCTHRNTQGCLATKQVQRADDDPSIFEVIYRGKHSCIQETLKRNKENRAKLQKKQENSQFLPVLKAETQVMDTKEESFPSFSFPATPIESDKLETPFFRDPNMGTTSYSSPFLSPATSDNEFAETISNPSPFVNLPFGDLGFSMDFDSHFIDTPEYYFS